MTDEFIAPKKKELEAGLTAIEDFSQYATQLSSEIAGKKLEPADLYNGIVEAIGITNQSSDPTQNLPIIEEFLTKVLDVVVPDIDDTTFAYRAAVEDMFNKDWARFME